MADIQIAITAKNDAAAALAQVNADLANLARTATETGNAMLSIGRTQFSLGAGSTVLRDTIKDLQNATEAATRLKQAVSEPARVQNAGGLENVTASIKQAETELAKLLKQYQELAAAGKVDIGGGNANLSAVQTAIAQQLGALKTLKAEAAAAAKAGVLGDGSAPAAQINQVTNAARLMQQALKSDEDQAKKTATALQNVAKGGAAGLSSLKNELSGVDRAFGGLNSVLSGGLGGVAGLVGLGATAAVIGQITGAINDAVLAADKVDKLKFSFDNLASSAGQSGDELLNALRGASRGMVTDADLIVSANKAMMLGVADNAQEMTALLDIARARGQAMGLDMTQAFNDIVVGLGRGSALILDNLGITVDAATANQAYADSIGKVVSQLTEQEKKQALINAVLEQSKNITGGGGSGASTASAQAQVAQANLQVQAGQFFAPGERDALQAQIDLIARASGSYSELNVILRETNDLQADSKSKSPLAVQVDPAQLANVKALGDAINLLQQAQASGVAGLDQYATALTQIGTASLNGINMTQQQANLTGLIVSGLREEVAAHNAKVQAMERANAEAARSVPYYQQIAAAQDEAAGAAFRASDEAQKLAQGFGFAGAIALAASNNIDELNLALGRLKANDALKTQADSLKAAAINQARSTVQAAVDSGRITASAGGQEFARLAGEIESLRGPATGAANDIFLFQQQVNSVDDSMANANDAFRQQNDAAKRLADEGLQKVKEQYDSILSKVTGLIQGAQTLPTFKASDILSADQISKAGLSGDSQISVDQAANGGISPDAINENARRLMAIAKEGFANQPWLEEFKREVPNVFKELESSPDIKGAAFNILKQFEDGMRPELLDQGQIKERVKKMILGEQNAAQLAQQIAQEIANEMGVSLQQAQQAANSVLGVGGGTDGATTGVTAPDMTPQGTQAGGTFRAGFVAGFDATGMTTEIVSKIDAEFSNPKSWLALNKSGTAVGAVWAGGFVAGASKETTAGVYEFFAAGLLPYVVAALQANGSRTGAQP